MATKKELRIRYKELRASLSPEKLERDSARTCRQIAQSSEFRAAQTVHLFLPIRRQKELNTYPLLDEIFRSGKTAVVSVSDFSSASMVHFRLQKGDALLENEFGIPEPLLPQELEPVRVDAIDLVLVPLLAYDCRGMRVGYGRGFYDRFLRECRADTCKAGVSFFPPEKEPVSDAWSEDVALDCCFTPQGKVTWLG